jgi:hypothetical protein
MNNLKILMFLFFSITVFSQDFNSELKLTNDSDTIYWKKYKNEVIKKYDLGFVENNESKVFFRFWSPGTTIEISKNENELHGNLIYFVKEYAEDSKKIFKKVYPLENKICLTIVKLIDSTKINSIPTDSQIKGWEHGFDGITYFIETKSEKEYSFKSYWTPSSQENIIEATKIKDFVNQLYKICNSEQISKEFRKEIPFISYAYEGSSYAVSRIMTQEEYKQYLKEKRKKKRNK